MEKQLTLFTPELPLTSLRTIKRALSLLDQHLREPGVAFTSTQAARDWLRLKMGTLEREDHPREVVKRALYFNAAAVIFAHNHPSGEVNPSQADKAITQRLVQALMLVEILWDANKGSSVQIKYHPYK